MKQMFWLLRRAWLPFFLVTGVSWLLAPALHHDHYGSLQLISSYEGSGQSLTWLFRLSDVFAATLLSSGVWLFGLWAKDRIAGWLIFVTGGLLAVDAIFTDKCDVFSATCRGLSQLSSGVHDTESVVVAVLVIGLGIYHARRYESRVSWWFVGLQLIIGLTVVSGLLGQQAIIVAQYAYELLIIGWLAWLMSTFAIVTSKRPNQMLRHMFGWWALLNGMLLIIVSLTHYRILRPLVDVTISHSYSIVGQHGVIAGVLMLYLARHIYHGQRRAAVILLLIFGTEIIKYSVITPSATLLGLNMLSFTLLLYGRRVFDKNTSPLPFAGRAKDALIVCVGVLVALVTSNYIASVTGHAGMLQQNLHNGYQRPAGIITRGTDVIDDYTDRVRLLGETLVVATIAVTAWSLFRPAKFHLRHVPDESRQAEALLRKFSTSTEDYFKLWPADKSYFFKPGIEGFVAYNVSGGIAFALADPIAGTSEQAELLRAFTDYCRKYGWNSCFLLIGENSKPLYETDFRLVKIGSSAVIDIDDFVNKTSRDKWWRWQRNRAEKSGLHYATSEPPHTPDLLNELRRVSDAWLDGANRSEQGFALGYFDEAYLQQCRLHLVRGEDNKLLAFANELPTYNYLRQQTVDLIRYSPDQNGTMPYLLQQIVHSLHEAGNVKTFDLGFVPLAGIDSVLVAGLRRLAAGRFSSVGLQQFKNKFDPTWQPNYLAYQGDVIDLARIAASLEAVLKRPA